MQRNAEPVRKLQLEIAELKKQFLVANETNQSFKIEIRKLQNEVTKKDKQIRQASIINKAISDKRVNSIHNLNEKNCQLQKEMAENDQIIENLQNGLPTVETRDNETSDDMTPRALKIPKHKVDLMVEELLHEVKCVTSDTRAVYQDLSREHLLSIIQSLKNSSILQDEKGTSWEEIKALPNNNEEICTKTKPSINTIIKSVFENGIVPNIDKLSSGLYTAWKYSKTPIFCIFILIYIYQLIKLHFW